MIRATSIINAPLPGSVPHSVTLSYEQRFLRRKRLQSDDGEAFLVDLPKAVSLSQGQAFVLEDGRLVAIIAAREQLLEVTGPHLARLAWHIGNRHTPCQIAPDRLLILNDRVLAQMLEKLGAGLRQTVEPFTPEGGAYGLGRTHGHAQDQGHQH